MILESGELNIQNEVEKIIKKKKHTNIARYIQARYNSLRNEAKNLGDTNYNTCQRIVRSYN
jgi:hypothetical protein